MARVMARAVAGIAKGSQSDRTHSADITVAANERRLDLRLDADDWVTTPGVVLEIGIERFFAGQWTLVASMTTRPGFRARDTGLPTLGALVPPGRTRVWIQPSEEWSCGVSAEAD